MEVASDGEVAEWLITELDELEVDDSAHEAAELAAPTGPVSPAAGAAELAAPTGPVSPAAGPSSAAPSSTAGSPSPTPPVDAVAPPPAAVTAGSTVPAAAETADPGDDPAIEEPIRTRSMAQLLAKQGHRQRALNIYAWLIKSNGSDASLKAEAEALRQSMAQEG